MRSTGSRQQQGLGNTCFTSRMSVMGAGFRAHVLLGPSDDNSCRTAFAVSQLEKGKIAHFAKCAPLRQPVGCLVSDAMLWIHFAFMHCMLRLNDCVTPRRCEVRKSLPGHLGNNDSTRMCQYMKPAYSHVPHQPAT